MSKLKIIRINPEPIESIEYFTIPHGAMSTEKFQLPIYVGEIAGLPKSIDSVVVTSDLQGVCRFEHASDVLLGEVLAERLSWLCCTVFAHAMQSEAFGPGRRLALAGSGANQNESPKTDNPNNSYKDEAPGESLVGETRF